MKKFLLLSASVLALNSVAPITSISAQNTGTEVISITQQHTTELQTALQEAVTIYQEYYPNANVTDIDIHLHQETNQFIVRILGLEGTTRYQLIRYNGENFFASGADDDDDEDVPINLQELAPIETVTQAAIDSAGSDKVVNWSLDSDDDDDDEELEWEITIIDNGREIEIEVDAFTGEVLEVDTDDDSNESDDDEDRQYYRQFYSDYSGSSPTVYDDDYYDDDYDDNYYDDDYDDDYYDDDDYDDDYYDDDYDDDDYYDDDYDDWDDDDDDDDWDD